MTNREEDIICILESRISMIKHRDTFCIHNGEKYIYFKEGESSEIDKYIERNFFRFSGDTCGRKNEIYQRFFNKKILCNSNVIFKFKYDIDFCGTELVSLNTCSIVACLTDTTYTEILMSYNRKDMLKFFIETAKYFDMDTLLEIRRIIGLISMRNMITYEDMDLIIDAVNTNNYEDLILLSEVL